jgi:branched-subunit amino acid ABC-type transport system permease component
MEFLYKLLLDPWVNMMTDPLFLGEVVIGGLLAGVMYSLVALGFVLIYKASGVFNFAQGVMVLFAALSLVGLMERGIPLWAAILLTGLIMLALAFAIERIILKHMVNQEQIILFMATIGLTFFLEGFGETLWGSNVKKLEIGIPDRAIDAKAITAGGGLLAACFALATGAAFFMVYRWRAHAVRRAAAFGIAGADSGFNRQERAFLVIGACVLALALIGMAAGGSFVKGKAEATRTFLWSAAMLGVAILAGAALLGFARTIGRRMAAADRGQEVPPLHYGWFVALGAAAAVAIVAGLAWAVKSGIQVNSFEGFAAVMAAILVVTLAIFFQKTRVGRALRAVADDHAAALSVGISLRGIWVIVWTVAGIVALAAGIIWGGKSGVQFSLSLIALKALPVLILGGFTSVPGAIIGGLIIGVGEKLAEVYWGLAIGIDAIENWFAYVLALVFLLFRPQGLFGEKIIERV